MKKILLFLVLLILLSQRIQAQEDAFHYLIPIEEKYAGLRDYMADVMVHFDIETFKAPDMQAKLCYKTPDKVKVESKRVFSFQEKAGTLIRPSSKKKALKSNFSNVQPRMAERQ